MTDKDLNLTPAEREELARLLNCADMPHGLARAVGNWIERLTPTPEPPTLRDKCLAHIPTLFNQEDVVDTTLAAVAEYVETMPSGSLLLVSRAELLTALRGETP